MDEIRLFSFKNRQHMGIIWSILKVSIFIGLLTPILRQSYKLIFIMALKPIVWIGFLAALNFLFFFIASIIQDSFNVVWWSSALSFFNLLSLNTQKENNGEIKKTTDDMYEIIGINKGRLKFRLGLYAYIVGGLLGWVIVYGEICTF